MQHRAVPDRRVGAAMLVLGTLLCHVFRRGSAGDAAKAPARGGGQALPGGACRALIPGRGTVRVDGRFEPNDDLLSLIAF